MCVFAYKQAFCVMVLCHAMPCHVMPCLVTLCREVMHVCTHVPTVGMHIRMLYVSTDASLCSSVVCIFFLPLFYLQDSPKQNTSKHQIWQRPWPARDKLPRSKITSTYPYTSKSNIPRQQYRAGTNHASGTGGMTTHTPLTDEPPITQAEAGTKPKNCFASPTNVYGLQRVTTQIKYIKLTNFSPHNQKAGNASNMQARRCLNRRLSDRERTTTKQKEITKGSEGSKA